MNRERQAVGENYALCPKRNREPVETRMQVLEGKPDLGDSSFGRAVRDRRRVDARGVMVAFALAIVAVNNIPSAGASEYSQQLSQYSHSIWRVQDGQFNRPNAIAQSKDGYLWIGTAAGLVRFDGVQFVPQNEYPDATLAEERIFAVAAAVDGSIWLGTSTGVSQIKDGRCHKFQLNGRGVIVKTEDSGDVWVFEERTNSNDGPVIKIVGTDVSYYGKPGQPVALITAVRQVGTGHFWLGGSTELCEWSPTIQSRCFLKEKLAPLADFMGVGAVHESRDGTLLIGLLRSGEGLGLGKVVAGHWVPFNVPGLRGDSLEVSAIVEDRAGSFWIGTTNKGLYRIRDGVAEHFGRDDGLSDNEIVVGGIFEDRDGGMWILTKSGLDQFNELPVSVFSSREGLPANEVESILADHAGRIWIGNSTLSVIEGGLLKTSGLPELYSGKSVTSMLEDHAHRLWIGLDRTLNVVDGTNTVEIKAIDGTEFGVAMGMTEDADGDVWVILAGASKRLARIHSLKVAEVIDASMSEGANALVSNPRGGILLGFVNGDIAAVDKSGFRLTAAKQNIGVIIDMSFDPDGKLIIASTTGLHVQLDVASDALTSVLGLPCREILSVVWDASSRLWANSRCGIFVIERADWMNWIARPEGDVKSVLFDVSQGAEPGTGSFTPKSSAASDGKVWFATSNVAEMIDPARIGGATIPPVVKIEQITADDVKQAAVNGVELAPGSRNINIRYTALVFSAPQKTKFRYRLEGRDQTWQDTSTRRQAFYTDLPPAKYTFLAQASTASGAWGEQSTAFKFEVLPAYYQTRWFLILCALGFVGLLYVAYVLRLRQVADELKRRLKVKSDERERIARDLHDTLLQDTQALVFAFQSVADESPPGTPFRERMEGALDRADRVLAEGRECVLDLRTDDALPGDLPDALAQVGDELSRSRSQSFRSVIEGTPQPLDPIVRDEVYRIAREAMVNAFRHAAASAVELQLIFAPEVFTVQIRDDGKGIDQETLQAGGREGHWGLRGMRERADRIGGRLEIWSGETPGTEVQLEIPARSAYRSLRRAGWSWIARLGIGGR